MHKIYPTRQFTRHLDDLSSFYKVYTGQPVVIDLEMWGMDEDKLHHPHGRFAAMVIALDNDSYVFTNKKEAKYAWDWIRAIPGTVIFHNAQFDITQMRGLGFDVLYGEFNLYDTMYADKVLWSNYFTYFGLPHLVRRYFNVIMDKETRATFSEEGVLEVLTKEQIEYTYLDGEYTLQLYDLQQGLLEEANLMHIWWEIEEPSYWAILDMDRPAIHVQEWRELIIKLEEHGNKLTYNLGINVKSWQQVSNFLWERYDICEWEDDGRRKKANTNAEGLWEYYNKDPEVRGYILKILEARKCRDVCEKNGLNYLDEHVLDDLTILAAYMQIGTMTGRHACKSPNLQNVPGREDGFDLGIEKMREFFYSRLGGEVLVTDAAQQESRLTAQYSGDPTLLQAIIDGVDLHLRVTQVVFNDDTIVKEDDRRKTGKAINLGMVYGLTKYGLSKALGISLEAAQDIIDIYFQGFPGIKPMLDRFKADAKKYEYVKTYMGRRVWVNLYNFNWENNAVNNPHQSGGADMMKLMVAHMRYIAYMEATPFRLSQIIHDEAVLGLHPDDDKPYYEDVVGRCWLHAGEKVMPNVPTGWDTKFGPTWAAKK